MYLYPELYIIIFVKERYILIKLLLYETGVLIFRHPIWTYD